MYSHEEGKHFLKHNHRKTENVFELSRFSERASEYTIDPYSKIDSTNEIGI